MSQLRLVSNRAGKDKNPISLADRRKQKKQKEMKSKMPQEQRIQDLEEELDRAISMIVDISRQLESQHNTVHKLLRLLKEHI